MTIATITHCRPDLADLADARANAAVRFAAAARELEELAARLVAIDQAYREERARSGLRGLCGPSAADLAARLVVGRCEALRPFLRFDGLEAAEVIEESLVRATGPSLLRTAEGDQ